MTKQELIFDWRGKESSFRLKLAAYLVVGVGFAFAVGALRIRVPAPAQARGAGASVIRFVEPEMAASWYLTAEENGPFPGGLDLGDFGDALNDGADDGLLQWSDYKAELRPLRDSAENGGEALSPKGVRVFPERNSTMQPRAATRKVRQLPLMTPYDTGSLAWMPETLPAFEMPDGADAGLAPWRFAVNLHENGSVRDVMPLAGGADPAQEAIGLWLAGIRFKEGSGDRWVGLRVEFVNTNDDGTEPE